jgi:hypothetical protein
MDKSSAGATVTLDGASKNLLRAPGLVGLSGPDLQQNILQAVRVDNEADGYHDEIGADDQ